MELLPSRVCSTATKMTLGACAHLYLWYRFIFGVAALAIGPTHTLQVDDLALHAEEGGLLLAFRISSRT